MCSDEPRHTTRAEGWAGEQPPRPSGRWRERCCTHVLTAPGCVRRGTGAQGYHAWEIQCHRGPGGARGPPSSPVGSQ
ncbi:hypothetical protein NDU88_010160 [Pleurodeles waltl]|uniref:Uncharacterized protein n=1 Tax=Pleurodeles waltl TaxID=8319 RepID=A0AAV7PUD9_PLEWA|nr:hypothetical protein NDU88_010160 [Pleurodeles waltl]